MHTYIHTYTHTYVHNHVFRSFHYNINKSPQLLLSLRQLLCEEGNGLRVNVCVFYAGPFSVSLFQLSLAAVAGTAARHGPWHRHSPLQHSERNHQKQELKGSARSASSSAAKVPARPPALAQDISFEPHALFRLLLLCGSLRVACSLRRARFVDSARGLALKRTDSTDLPWPDQLK